MHESDSKKISLLNLDWQGVVKLIQNHDPKEDVWYMITINKSQDNEYRTKFMQFEEVLELATYTLAKKQVRIKA